MCIHRSEKRTFNDNIILCTFSLTLIFYITVLQYFKSLLVIYIIIKSDKT